tara:strand:- start:26 stop:349 length:324 start_codon:yes stop_codon:yes gene_type:complete
MTTIPFFVVCRSTAVRRILGNDAVFLDRGTHIEWLPENKAGTVTEEQIAAKMVELQAEFDALEWARLRQSEYPPFDEQLDFIYHNGIEKWKTDMIDPVKKKYPKPTE